jgi:hypothetical protein
MRCNTACTDASAPSAVCVSDAPSSLHRTAALKLRMRARTFSEIAKPAASSAAELTRVPEDIRPAALPIALFCMVYKRWMNSAMRLFLMCMTILHDPFPASLHFTNEFADHFILNIVILSGFLYSRLLGMEVYS